MNDADKKLLELDAEKRELCAYFRSKLSNILTRERQVLGLTAQEYYEIKIYY